MSIVNHNCGVPDIQENLNNVWAKHAIPTLQLSFRAMQEYRNHVNANALDCPNIKIITDFFSNKTLAIGNYSYISMLMELNATSPGNYFLNYINTMHESQLTDIYKYFTKDKKNLVRERPAEFVRLRERIIEENCLGELKAEKGFNLDAFYKGLPDEYQLGVML